MLLNQAKASRNRVAVIACTIALLTGCDSPEEAATNHFQKGKELFEKGEFDKAFLELKSSAQSDDKRGETYYYMALLDEKSSNFKSMRQNLIRALELAPNSLDARLKLGKVDILFGDLDKALEQARSILAVDANNRDARLLEASVYMRQAKQDKASEIVQEVLISNPDNIDALSLSAALHYERNEVEKALVSIDKALDKDGKNLSLRLFKIKINAGQNNTDGVITGYKEIIELYPENDGFKLSLASVYSMTNKLEEAEALLRKIVAEQKENGKAESEIVLLDFLNARAKERVLGEYQNMLAQHKGQSSPLLELSKWMVASGYVEPAKDGLQQVVALEKNSEVGLAAQTILAEIALLNKQYDEVADLLQKIISANSEFTPANLLKARLLLSQNKIDDAIELLNKLIWGKNSTDDAYLLLGQAYDAKQDRKQAERNYKQALETNPANLGAFAHVFGGYMQAGQKEMARQYLEKALKIKPNQVILLTNKAELDILEKKWDDAQNTIQRLALFSKEKAVPVYLQANLLQGKGKYSEAVNIYDKLLQEFPGHRNSMINLIRCYDAIDSRDKAVDYLEKHHGEHLDDAAIVGVLTDLYVADNNYAKARKLLGEQVKRSPESVAVYIALAKVETLASKDLLAAKPVYLKGLDINKDDPQLSLALAGLYEQVNDKENARKIYQALLDKHPDIDLAVNNFASLLIESESLDDINKGLNLANKFKDSENPYFQDTYAWGLIRSGNVSEGLKLLEAIILKEPRLSEFRYHLGVAHFNSGNKATAISELKQALVLSEKQKRSFSGIDSAKKILAELERPASK